MQIIYASSVAKPTFLSAPNIKCLVFLLGKLDSGALWRAHCAPLHCAIPLSLIRDLYLRVSWAIASHKAAGDHLRRAFSHVNGV
jgi:hypothetical protein